MTRQRKTHILILALVPVIVFGAVRCADSTMTAPPAVQIATGQLDPAVEARLAKLHQENDWVGEFHNDALKYVFANLRRMPAKGRDRHGVCEEARKAYADFHKARRGSSVPVSVDADFEKFLPHRFGGNASANGSPEGTKRTVSRRLHAGFSSRSRQPLVRRPPPAICAPASTLSRRTQPLTLSAVEAGAVVTVGSIASQLRELLGRKHLRLGTVHEYWGLLAAAHIASFCARPWNECSCIR